MTVTVTHATTAAFPAQAAVSAMLPSFLYIRDQSNPRLIQFLQARAVPYEKRFPAEISARSFEQCSRLRDEFAMRVEQSVFLFVAEPQSPQPHRGGGGARQRPPMPRGFKPVAHLASAEPAACWRLKEETNALIVSEAWELFMGSALIETSLESDMVVPASGPVHDLDHHRDGLAALRQIRLQLASMRTCSVSCTVAQYSCCLPQPQSTGVMTFCQACNVTCCRVEIPVLAVESEVICPSGCTTEEEMSRAAQAAHARYSFHALLPAPERGQVRGSAFYAKALLNARLGAIRSHRNKSFLLMEMLDGRTFRFHAEAECTRGVQELVPCCRWERKGRTHRHSDSAAPASASDTAIADDDVHDELAPTPEQYLCRIFDHVQQSASALQGMQLSHHPRGP